VQKSDGGGEEFESAIAFGSWRELALKGRGTGDDGGPSLHAGCRSWKPCCNAGLGTLHCHL
jgi:hypothetical protein